VPIQISLERIGAELDKMLTYGDPAKSLSLICNDVSIHKTLFDLSPTSKSFSSILLIFAIKVLVL
jgi:tRNA nucleotidyltransferase/poly(A) polymerase